jgi:hypothetical protein
MFDEGTQNARGASRTNLYLAATLVAANSRVAVTVRNLSASGALVRAPLALPDDGPVSLLRGSLSVTGTLAWRDGLNGGIRFDSPIDPGEWAPAVAAGQRDVDRMIAQSRGQVAPLLQRKPSAVPLEQRRAGLVTRIAEEIACAARRLEALGSNLADDPAVIVRHAGDLQQLDITVQVLGHLTRLLGCAEPETLLGEIGMDDLRRRLERVAIAP